MATPPTHSHSKGKAKDTCPSSLEETSLGSSSSSGIGDVLSEVNAEEVEEAHNTGENLWSSIDAEQAREDDDEDEVVISPAEEPINNGDTEVSQDETLENPQPTGPPQASRQFPPPGTLVVVQGVVHTTDVPRAAPIEPVPTPPSRPVSRSRNRLSALLPRRAASFSGEGTTVRYPVVPSSSSSNLEVPSLNYDSDSRTSSPSPGTGNFSGGDVPPNTTAATTPTSELPLPPPEDGARVISPSSIDVLGTLLRYASGSICSYIFF
jgi:hypothetical protein